MPEKTPLELALERAKEQAPETGDVDPFIADPVPPPPAPLPPAPTPWCETDTERSA
jgi:hypothetical protein